ncbi:MAG: DUF4097 domain-containing protein, partial [Bacteroidota bacterium]|nr:DUF4097 domain-containing protein [Bacteroidota bacterium]
MNKIIFLVFALISFTPGFKSYSNYIYSKASIASFQESPIGEEKPYLTKEFTLDKVGNLKIKTSGGSIHVFGKGGNVVTVEMYIRSLTGGKKSASGIEKALKNYELKILKEDNTVSVIAESKGWTWKAKNNLNISFIVYVPYEISSDLYTSGGSINISDVKGFQKVYTSGGSINCKAVDGNVKASTSGGSIHIENYEGELDASTSGGSIILKNANGNLKVHTSGGGISLNDVSGDIIGTTSGGGITANIN